MSKLLPVTVASIVLAWLSQHVNVRRLTSDNHYRKDWLFFAVMVLIMVLFAGLRTRFNDTITYITTYNNSSSQMHIRWIIGENPGYQIIIKALKKFNFSSQSYILFYSAITLIISLWFIRKYSTNIVFSIFLFITLGYYAFTFAAVKQCAAIALCLIALHFYLCRRYFRFVFFVIVGALFHPYALMFLFVPLLDFRPWNKKTIILLFAFLIAGLALQPLLGPVVSITTMLGEEFNEEALLGEGINPFRLAVTAVPIVLSFLSRRIIEEENSREQNILLNLSMISGTIMFVGLFGTANYFARLAYYFLIFQTISIPWLLSHYEFHTRRVISSLAVMGYTLFFVYSNMFNGRFDSAYSSVSLFRYISSLF